MHSLLLYRCAGSPAAYSIGCGALRRQICCIIVVHAALLEHLMPISSMLAASRGLGYEIWGIPLHKDLTGHCCQMLRLATHQFNACGLDHVMSQTIMLHTMSEIHNCVGLRPRTCGCLNTYFWDNKAMRTLIPSKLRPEKSLKKAASCIYAARVPKNSVM